MQEFDNIKDMLYCEIDEISKQGKLDMNTLKILGEIVDVLKDVGSIEMFEEYGENPEEEEYSFGYRNGGYSQRRPMMYYDNNSYRDNGGYSRNNGNYGRNGGYSRRGRNGGYSRDDAKDHMIHKLENLMNETQDQKDKDSIQRLIEQMEHDN